MRVIATSIHEMPEPPTLDEARRAERSAGVRDGVEALAFGITETRTTSTTK
jgi:hypothetical protein